MHIYITYTYSFTGVSVVFFLYINCRPLTICLLIIFAVKISLNLVSLNCEKTKKKITLIRVIILMSNRISTVLMA